MAALRAAVPEIPEGGSISALDSADKLRAELAAAGFVDIEVHEITHAMRYDSAAAAWHMMERGSAPVVLLADQLGDEWPRRSRAAIDYLAGALDFPCGLEQTAFIGVARRSPGPTPA